MVIIKGKLAKLLRYHRFSDKRLNFTDFFHFGDSVIPNNKIHISVEDEASSMCL